MKIVAMHLQIEFWI